jgi:hypothetical protein
MTAHFAIAQFNVRTFKKSDNIDVNKPTHAMSAPYDQFFTVHIDDAGTARTEGLHSPLTKSQLRSLKQACTDFGAKLFTYRHSGVEHVESLVGKSKT